ncbi:MAG: hypothetical protein EOP61_12675 [Sphingomonadales bacterium]|nr:MAG: hypothetical protein EOP61_12675 [Sphingomonadales bacterium]
MVPATVSASAAPELQQRHGQNAAPQRHNQRATPQRQNRNDRGNWKKWRKGDRFDQRHARNYQQVDYRRYRGLKAPPRGYRWVRSDDDAVLVAIGTGVIASIIVNAIR